MYLLQVIIIGNRLSSMALVLIFFSATATLSVVEIFSRLASSTLDVMLKVHKLYQLD